jgi:hypothetical protein
VLIKTVKGYQRDFPEEFNWEMIDSNLIRPIAVYLAATIKSDFRLGERTRIPGIRYALNVIADNEEAS